MVQVGRMGMGVFFIVMGMLVGMFEPRKRMVCVVVMQVVVCMQVRVRHHLMPVRVLVRFPHSIISAQQHEEEPQIELQGRSFA